MALLGSLAGVIMVFVAMAMLENTLRKLDNDNREQLTWDCTNHDANVCVLAKR